MDALDVNTLFLCFAVAVCTFAFLTRANQDWNPEQFLSKKGNYRAAVILLLAIAVFIRVYKFGMVPAGVNQDGAMAAVDANALAHYGTDRFGMRFPVYFTAWDYSQMGVLLSYCMVPFIRIFGLTVTAIRLPMLLASLAGIWVLFRFSEKLFGRLPALLVLAVVSIDPWHIMQSRWALESNLLPHFLLFSMYFLYLGLSKRRFLFLSMFLFALTMYSYGIAFYSVPLLLAILCVYLLAQKRIKPWEAGVSALIYLIFAWPILAVVIINAFKLPTLSTGLVTVPFFPDSIRMNDLIVYSKDVLLQAVSNLSSFANIVILEKSDFSWNSISNFGHMYLFTLPFILTGLWFLLRGVLTKPGPGLAPEAAESVRKEKAGRFLLVAWLAVSVISGLMVNGVDTNRVNIVFYPLCILAALGLWHVLFQAVRIRKIAILVAIMYAVSFGGFTTAYFGERSQLLANEFCSGFTDAVHYADSLDTDVLYITAYSREEDSTTCSEIYTLFGADIDARYFQGNAVAFKGGRQLLPYKERYQYVNFSDFDFSQPVGSVYVFNAKEEDLFSQDEYDIRMFDGFGVAVKTTDEYDLPDPDDDQPVG